MAFDLDTTWRGAVITGVVVLNFKLVLDGIRGYKARKNGKYNGSDRRFIKYENECHKDMTAMQEKFADSIGKVHTKVNTIGSDVSYIKGKLDAGG